MGWLSVLFANLNFFDLAISGANHSCILEKVRVDNQLPSLGVTKLTNGSFSSDVVGFRKQNDSTLVQLTDKFHLGSDTKAMTATLFAIFIERGIFHWNDTLFETLPPNIVESMHTAHHNTTLDMLALHISGLADLEAPFPPPLFNFSIVPKEGREIWTTTVLSKPPTSTPGTNFTYSNTNYVILGHILESRLQTTWESLITTELFHKIGMKGCGFGTPPESTNSSIENPWPHSPSSNGPIPVNPKSPYSDNIPSLGPAGTVHCSLSSWSKFIQLHLDGHAGRPTPILKQSSFVTLHAPGSSLSRYTHGAWNAFSNIEQPWAKGLVLTHAGSNTLNFAVAWLDIDANTAYLAATNVGGSGAENGTNQAVIEMISGNVLG